ncbi:hypothetical protein [Pasteurella multocida]|uniref:hypothetical protein n=1 Tax=Pasteurella multocida TaxID=747 RepID=UPI00209BB827|nr:hypothetical protein [Pasteurella multocida]
MRLNNGGASGGRTLVVAPLSILQCSWGNDIEKFTPEPTYAIADAKTVRARLTQVLILYSLTMMGLNS